MDDLTRDLLWLGVEDYTGLWSAAAEVQTAKGLQSAEDARALARHVLESLLADGLIDLFTCRWTDDDFAVVLPPDRSALLQDEDSWTAGEERILFWFGFRFLQEGNRLGITADRV